MKTLYTPSEVDRLLRYPQGRTRRLARRGVLPCILLPDGEIRFDRAMVDRFMAGQKSSSAFGRRSRGTGFAGIDIPRSAAVSSTRQIEGRSDA